MTRNFKAPCTERRIGLENYKVQSNCFPNVSCMFVTQIKPSRDVCSCQCADQHLYYTFGKRENLGEFRDLGRGEEEREREKWDWMEKIPPL